MAMQQGQTFVGRQREMEILPSALEKTLAGHGQMIMLAGEPGIGKTSAARNFAAHAEEQGAKVLWGWCYEGDGAPSYWPWTHAIAPYIELLDPADLSNLLGGNPRLGEIIPQIRQKLPDLPTPPPLEPDQAQFQLFDSVAAFLKSTANASPMLIVLEDLHRADRASLMLLEFVINGVSSSPLMLLGTYRDVEVGRRHPLFQTLGELTRDANFQRLHLNNFGPEDVAQFVESRAAIALNAADLELVHSRTAGNPFFLTELMRLQEDEGQTDAEAWKTGLPEGIRDVIGRRLNRLSDQCNQTLSTASVIGPEFGFQQLGPLLEELSPDQLLESVEEALTAQLIEESPGAPGRYLFAHALIQQTLGEEHSMASRLRLHVRIAESMEVHLGDEAVNHAAVLAHHYSQGAMLSGTEKMLFYSRLAGEQALENFAYEEALEHFERALAVSQDLSMDLQQAQMLHGLGRAQVATLPRNRVGQAIATLTRAFDFFVESGDLNRAVAVASIPIEGFGFGHRTGIGSNIERALALVEPDSLHAGLLLSRHGRVMGMEEGNFEAAEDNFGQALKIARELGDAPLELWTLTVAANVEFFHLRARDTLDNASRAIELAVVAQDLKTEVTARFWAAAAMWTMGDLPRLQIQAEAMLEGAERLRDRYWLASTLWRNETVCILKGDWKSAREFNTRGLEVSDLDQRLISTRILLEFHSGNIEEGTGFIDTALEIAGAGQFRPTPGLGYTAMVIALVNRVAGGTVRRVEAEEIAKMIISSSTATPRVKSYARVAQGLNAAEANDKETAGEVYESLLPILAESPIQYMSIERLLGILRLTMGDVDGAINHFEDAISFCRNGGFRPELAWTCRDYAEALIQRGDDHGLSRKLVAQALEISIELDMPPLTDQLEAIQERIATETPNSPDYPDNLTLREVEVLRLVAVGKTDREIGDELFISFRTVGNHVRSILNKTGAANRTEAASYATLHGLTAARG